MAYSQCLPLLQEIISILFERAGLEFQKGVYKNGTYLIELFKLKLDKIFAKHFFVLLIDELDTLATHDQKNFELVNDFLSIASRGFVKIGISNTLDLFSKYKGTKQTLECRQMAFKPYADSDFWGILKERMESSLRGGSVELSSLCDEDSMRKVCLKIHKHATGDIRIMLAIVKDIFERKFLRLKKEVEIKDPKEPGAVLLQLNDVRVSLQEAVTVVDEKYSDVQRKVIKTLSLNIQLCLMSVYFCLSDKQTVVSYDAFNSQLKECMEDMNVGMAHQDLEQNLMLLEVYNFIKIVPKIGKTKGPLHSCNIQSLYCKESLKGYLMELPALRLFFPQAPA